MSGKRKAQQVTFPYAQALPLIYKDSATNAFVCNPAGLSFLESLTGPIGVVAAAGQYRTGKSSFLNQALLQSKPGQGFGVGDTVQACTKGLWIYTQPIEGRDAEGRAFSVIAIDTEGLSSMDADQTHDVQIFTLALLLSSLFIYNSMGTINEQSLKTLNLVIQVTNQVHLKAQDPAVSVAATDGEKKKKSDLAAHFPAFVWVIRDMVLEMKSREGKLMSPDEYLQDALNTGSNTELRQVIKEVFPHRSCLTLVRPSLDEGQLRQMDQMGEKVWRPEFRRDMQAARDFLHARVPYKTVMGRKITGRNLAALCTLWVETLNKGAAPIIEDQWTLMSKSSADDAYRDAVAAWDEDVSALMHSGAPGVVAEPTTANMFVPEIFTTYVEERYKSCVELFDSLAFGELAPRLRTTLLQFLAKSRADALARNMERCNSLMQHLLQRIAMPDEQFLDRMIDNPAGAIKHIKEQFQDTYVQAFCHLKAEAHGINLRPGGGNGGNGGKRKKMSIVQASHWANQSAQGKALWDTLSLPYIWRWVETCLTALLHKVTVEREAMSKMSTVEDEYKVKVADMEAKVVAAKTALTQEHEAMTKRYDELRGEMSEDHKKRVELERQLVLQQESAEDDKVKVAQTCQEAVEARDTALMQITALQSQMEDGKRRVRELEHRLVKTATWEHEMRNAKKQLLQTETQLHTVTEERDKAEHRITHEMTHMQTQMQSQMQTMQQHYVQAQQAAAQQKALADKLHVQYMEVEKQLVEKVALVKHTQEALAAEETGRREDAKKREEKFFKELKTFQDKEEETSTKLLQEQLVASRKVKEMELEVKRVQGKLTLLQTQQAEWNKEQAKYRECKTELEEARVELSHKAAKYKHMYEDNVEKDKKIEQLIKEHHELREKLLGSQREFAFLQMQNKMQMGHMAAASNRSTSGLVAAVQAGSNNGSGDGGGRGTATPFPM